MNEVYAKQLTQNTVVLVGTPPDLQYEEGAEGEWLVRETGRQYLRSNRQFALFYEPTERAGVYRER